MHIPTSRNIPCTYWMLIHWLCDSLMTGFCVGKHQLELTIIGEMSIYYRFLNILLVNDVGQYLAMILGHQLKHNVHSNDMGEPAVSYNEPVEFEKYPVEVQGCRKITDHFRGICRIYPNLVKENRRVSTCNRLDLQTQGSQPVMPENLPDHWYTGFNYTYLDITWTWSMKYSWSLNMMWLTIEALNLFKSWPRLS